MSLLIQFPSVMTTTANFCCYLRADILIKSETNSINVGNHFRILKVILIDMASLYCPPITFIPYLLHFYIVPRYCNYCISILSLYIGIYFIKVCIILLYYHTIYFYIIYLYCLFISRLYSASILSVKCLYIEVFKYIHSCIISFWSKLSVMCHYFVFILSPLFSVYCVYIVYNFVSIFYLFLGILFCNSSLRFFYIVFHYFLFICLASESFLWSQEFKIMIFVVIFPL